MLETRVKSALHFCKRTVRVARKDISPVWTRSFPVSKQPETLGQHLRKKRFDSGLRQSEVAKRLDVSDRTLSVWESDRTYPAWEYWPRIVSYLGYDPFTDPSLGRPKGNETHDVAFSLSAPAATLGQMLAKRRLEMRKTRLQCAKELGVCVKTLHGWETDQRIPSRHLKESIVRFLGQLATCQ